MKMRIILGAALLASSGPALARVGPEIAYSSGSEIYLVNPDGSGKVRIYRGKGNSFISSVSLVKDGGGAAFVENWVVKFVSFTSTGQQVGAVRSIPTCYRSADVNYRPDRQSVVYQELCGSGRSIKLVAVPSDANPNPVPETLVSNPDIIDVGGWDGAGASFVYTLSNAAGWELRRHFVGGGDVLVASASSPGPQLRYPAISPDGLRVIAADWNGSNAIAGTGYIDEYDSSSGAPVRSNFITGQRADYSPYSGDARILFTVKEGRSQYLRYLDSDGLTKQIGGSGTFNDIDWGD
jgi:hypothetical protein